MLIKYTIFNRLTISFDYIQLDAVDILHLCCAIYIHEHNSVISYAHVYLIIYIQYNNDIHILFNVAICIPYIYCKS